MVEVLSFESVGEPALGVVDSVGVESLTGVESVCNTSALYVESDRVRPALEDESVCDTVYASRAESTCEKKLLRVVDSWREVEFNTETGSVRESSNSDIVGSSCGLMVCLVARYVNGVDCD